MATITTTTASPVFQYPNESAITRNPVNGDLWCIVRVTSGNLELFKSTNNGVSWATSGLSFSRANLQEWGGFFVDNGGRGHIYYRTSEAPFGVNSDRIYYRYVQLSPAVLGSELLVAAGANGGVAGNCYRGVDMTVVLQNNGWRFLLFAIGLPGFMTSGKYGVYMKGATIAANGQWSTPDAIAGGRVYYISGTSGNVNPSVDIEHNGDGLSSSVPNAWVSFGRNKLHVARGAWVYGKGWQFPTSAIIPPRTNWVAQTISPGRWDGQRFLTCAVNFDDTTTIDVYERDKSNTTWATRTSPVHPTGVVRNCSINFDGRTGNFRLYAVGTSTGVLYYVDYLRGSATWTSWNTVLATAILGANADNWSVRRGSWGNARYDVATAHSGAPNTLTHTSQQIAYAPNPPTWNAATGISGSAKNVAASLLLDWDFSDPDVNDTQLAYAVSRQIGAGALNYWRASDSTWQVAEVQNTSGTSAITVASGWGADLDANYTFKAKVWDQASTASTYGPAFVVIPSAVVNPAITQPTAAQVITTGVLAVAWTATQQTTYRVTIQPNPNPDGTYLYDSGTVFNTADRALTVPNVLTDNSAFTVTLQTGNDEGLASTIQSVNFTTDYAEPPTPTLVNTAMPSLGIIRSVITNPPTLSGPTTFVAAGTAATGNNSSLNPGAPAGKAVGDLLLLLASIRNSGTGNPNTPSGWTSVFGGNNIRLFKRIADGTAADTPTVTFNAGAAGDDTLAQIAAFRGCSATLTGSATVLNGSAQDIGTPALNVLIDNQLVISMGWKQDDLTSSTFVAGGVEIGEISSTAGNDSSMAWYYQIQTTATNRGTGTMTIVGGAAAISRGILVSFDTTPLVINQDLYRRVVGDTGSGIRIATGLDLNSTYDDYTAVSGVAYEYQAVAQGSNSTFASSAWTT